METELQGQTVLVTGASGGIGAATVRALVAEGAAPVLHYHRNRAAAQSLAEELDIAGDRVIGADIGDEAETDALFDAAVAAVGRLDHVVINAGLWEETARPLHEMELEQWRRTMRTNLDGAFLSCRAYLRHLAQAPRERASLVLVASTAALFGEAGHADYSASKAGLAYGLTLSLKNEIVQLAPRGRVNCICPGWVATPMAAGAMQRPGAVERATATMPLRKIAHPDDVARAVVFLTSDRLAGHLSGTLLPVAGGMEGRLLWET